MIICQKESNVDPFYDETHKSSESEIYAAATEAGMPSLKADGLNKVLKGLTTIEEVMRAVRK